MTVKTLPVGFMETNCYLIYNDDEKTAAIVDPGFEPDRIIAAVKSGYDVKAILITHPHYDHISACRAVAEHFDAPVYCFETAADVIKNTDNAKGLAVCLNRVAPVDEPIAVSDGDVIKIGGMDIAVLHTPGHCVGSCCYVIGDCIFSGDCLFRLEIGRCDLPTGDYGVMLNSLSRLMQFYKEHGDKKVYPGHGPDSALSIEANGNYYVREAVQ